MLYHFSTEQKCENKESWCEAARPDCSMATTKENCQKYCGLCGGICNVSLDHFYILLKHSVRRTWFMSKSLNSHDVLPLILGNSYPLNGNYNSEKKTASCNYRCGNDGGCEVHYTGPPRRGQIMGSCFPPSYGGSCSGTPRECNDCNKVLNCYEPKNWKQIKSSVKIRDTKIPLCILLSI